MVVTLIGIVTEVKPEQSSKAEQSMVVTLFGIVTEVMPVQPENAEPPMEVTLLGIVTEVMPMQPENAELDILTVPSLRVIEVPSGISPLYLYATSLM